MAVAQCSRRTKAKRKREEKKMETKTKNSSQATLCTVVSWFVAVAVAVAMTMALVARWSNGRRICLVRILLCFCILCECVWHEEVYVNMPKGLANSQLLYDNNNNENDEYEDQANEWKNDETITTKLELLKVQTYKWQWWRTWTTVCTVFWTQILEYISFFQNINIHPSALFALSIPLRAHHYKHTILGPWWHGHRAMLMYLYIVPSNKMKKWRIMVVAFFARRHGI